MVRILAVWSWLGPFWASMARVSPVELRHGKQRAVRGVNIAMLHDTDTFLENIARAAAHFEPGTSRDHLTHDPSEHGHDPRVIAEALGWFFGDEMGAHLLHAIAEMDPSIGEEVSADLDDLLNVVRLGAVRGEGMSDREKLEELAELEAKREGATGHVIDVARDTIGETGQEELQDTGRSGAEQSPPFETDMLSSPDATDTEALASAQHGQAQTNELLGTALVDEPLETVRALLAEAPDLCEALRQVADAVEAGTTRGSWEASQPEWPTKVAERLVNWAARAAASLPQGGTLEQQLEVLEQLARARDESYRLEQQRAARHQVLTDLRAGAQALRSSNLEHLVASLLEREGFASLSEVEGALAEIESTKPTAHEAQPDSPLTTPSASQTGHVPPAVDGAEGVSRGPDDQTGTPTGEQQRGVTTSRASEASAEVLAAPHGLEQASDKDDTAGVADTDQHSTRTELADATPLPTPTETSSVLPGGVHAAAVDAEPTPEGVIPATLNEEKSISQHPKSSTQLDAGALTSVSETPRRSNGTQDPSIETEDALTGCALPSDPWTEPEMPLVAQLIRERREHVAVLLAESEEEGSARTRVLRLFAAAFGTHSDTTQIQLPDLVLVGAEVDALRPDEQRILLAAGARLALELGYSPVGSLDFIRERGALDDHPAQSLLVEVSNLASRGFRRGSLLSGASALPNDWATLAEDAEVLMGALAKKRLSFQRSSKVAHYLARRNQPLGGALSLLQGLAEQHQSGQDVDDQAWADLAENVRAWSKPATRDRLIENADIAVSTSQQRRKGIEGDGRAGLIAAVEEVVALLESGLALRTTSQAHGSPNTQDAAALSYALASVTDLPMTSPGDAALARLVDWLREDNLAMLSREPLDRQLADVLAPLFEIPRDLHDRPVRGPSRDELDALVRTREPLEVVRGYLAVGNRRAAEQFLTIAAVPRTDALDDELLVARRRLEKQHSEAVAEADRLVSRLRSLNDDEDARNLAVRVEELRAPVPDRYDLALRPLADVVDESRTHLAAVRQGLLDRVEQIESANSAAAARIRPLIEGEDEPLAVEYLTLAEAGEELPTLEPPPGDDFASFFPAVVAAAAAAPKGKGVVTDVRAHLGQVGQPESRVFAQGLKAWRDLDEQKQNGGQQAVSDRISAVLRLAGLVPSSHRHPPLNRARRAGYATFEVDAAPVDRSYVPSFGTQTHGRYDITLVWDESSPQRLLQFIEEDRRSRANIVLYFGTLTVKQRYELRKLTARSGFEFSPLIIDHPVVAWLSHLPEPGWRHTQRVTLPFTTINPYTPFAGGEVPDEVFVGRELERRDIVNPTGSMFVYGGRQLGKSALLRRVEREFTSRRRSTEGDDGRRALYLDLKSASIGEAAPPDSLWPTLAPLLAKQGIIPTDARRTWNADSLPRAIQEWLDEDEARQFLLLLDEADNFLTSDSRNVTENGQGGFPTLQRLKGLMERSGRRFKPVFAGLHQVQRFHGLPNTPVAHGGKDILVGPLKPVDARQLVRDPMYALGYEFETDETMWRLLLLTNYQASLIQIICYQLLQHIRTIPLPESGGRVVITNRHIDEVYAKQEVRDLIAARFRWTINLDPRYLVIAMVTAWHSFDSAPGKSFSPADLQNECEYFWPEGFARKSLSSSEFMRYLDEMKGLGVLHRQGDNFGLRSPSIRGLLGTRQSIESELQEVAETLNVDLGYNPSLNRRMIHRDMPSGTEQRSPLCDADLGQLLGRAHVVLGTKGLGLARVGSALELVAEERGRGAASLTLRDVPEALRRRSQQVHVIDLSDVDGIDLSEQLAAAHRANVTAVLIAGPDQIGELDVDDARVLILRRWSLEALQSWQETPFSTPALRQLLKRVTGGWPELVEKAAARISQGADPASAINVIGASLSDRDSAEEFLASTGVAASVATRWAEWFGRAGDDGLQECAPATLDDLTAAGFSVNVPDLISRLQVCDVVEDTEQGWVLERAVTQAALALMP